MEGLWVLREGGLLADFSVPPVIHDCERGGGSLLSTQSEGCAEGGLGYWGAGGGQGPCWLWEGLAARERQDTPARASPHPDAGPRGQERKQEGGLRLCWGTGCDGWGQPGPQVRDGWAMKVNMKPASGP